MSQVTENNGKPHRNDSGTRHKVACIHDIVLLDECLHPNWVVTALPRSSPHTQVTQALKQ